MRTVLATLITSLALATLLTGFAPENARAQTPSIPEGAQPLNDTEIKALMGGGGTFVFVGGEAPIKGTSTWDLATGTAFGTFVWADTIKGSWNHRWLVRDNKSCLEISATQTVCESIYRYGDGFMEVDDDGTIHTVTTPIQVGPLRRPLQPAEAKQMLEQMMVWLQSGDVSVGKVQDSGNSKITADLTAADGSSAGRFEIDQRTGWMGPAP